MYIHELPEWSRFKWDGARVAGPLASVHYGRGRLAGQMEAFDSTLRQEAVLKTLTGDVLRTSEIEGQLLDAGQVRSALAQRLKMDIGPLKPAAPQAEGLVDMVFDASRCLDQPLTAERLFTWQASLFPDGRNGSRNFRLGAWRDGGAGAGETAPFTPAEGFPHYKPPPAARLPGEMQNYLDWFNSDATGDPVLKAALAHLGFVTIHPFDAGNGLIARAITDLALARCESSTHRFYSLSAQIALERSDYFSILEQTLQGTMDITPWLEWFLGCLGRAIDGAQITLKAVIGKAKFWQDNAALAINDRQRRALNQLLDYVNPKFTTLSYAKFAKKFAKCSHDTALRDILSLVKRGIFVRNSKGGRSTTYSLGPLR